MFVRDVEEALKKFIYEGKKTRKLNHIINSTNFLMRLKS
jgi:hypothetical protein